MTTVTMSLSEVKARLSEVVRIVETGHARFVIERHRQPVAIIMPVGAPQYESASGILSQYADTSRLGEEDGAFARAMEAKHAARR